MTDNIRERLKNTGVGYTRAVAKEMLKRAGITLSADFSIRRVHTVNGECIILKFYDWGPQMEWYRSTSGNVYRITDKHGTCINMGVFSEDEYKEILRSWKEFQEDFRYVKRTGKWIPQTNL